MFAFEGLILTLVMARETF